MDNSQSQPEPVIPPQWYVDRVNNNRPGLPPLTRLDPQVMALWRIATEPGAGRLLMVTGI